MIKNIFVITAFMMPLIAINNTNAAEFSLNAGMQNHDATLETLNAEVNAQDNSGTGYHFGFSMKNQLGKSGKHYLGVGIDVDDILDSRLIGYRAIDYQRAFGSSFRVGGFLGAASIDTGLPQNGYYVGTNISYYTLNHKLGITFELRHGNGLARDNRNELDPENTLDTPRPDIFLDYIAAGLQLSWTF